MTQRETVLAMLEQGPQTTASFLKARIPRFSARLEELRLEGYEITSTQLKASSWRYELTGATDKPEPQIRVLDYTGDEPVHGFRPLGAVIRDFKLENENPQDAGS